MLWFEWDYAKAESNEKKHQIGFHEAATVFSDLLSHTYPDPMHSRLEHRYITMGLSEFQRLLVVAHTEERNIIRIISARKATRRERRFYEENK
ncbi:BrnT family toxin [bacterium]|nr:BrnT family toxin [bacterium]